MPTDSDPVLERIPRASPDQAESLDGLHTCGHRDADRDVLGETPVRLRGESSADGSALPLGRSLPAHGPCTSSRVPRRVDGLDADGRPLWLLTLRASSIAAGLDGWLVVRGPGEARNWSWRRAVSSGLSGTCAPGAAAPEASGGIGGAAKVNEGSSSLAGARGAVGLHGGLTIEAGR